MVRFLRTTHCGCDPGSSNLQYGFSSEMCNRDFVQMLTFVESEEIWIVRWRDLSTQPLSKVNMVEFSVSVHTIIMRLKYIFTDNKYT